MEVFVFPTPFAIATSAIFLVFSLLGVLIPPIEKNNVVLHPPMLLCPSFKKSSLIPVANLICIAQLIHFLSAVYCEWDDSPLCFPVKSSASCTTETVKRNWCIAPDKIRQIFDMQPLVAPSLCPAHSFCMHSGLFVKNLGLLIDTQRHQSLQITAKRHAACPLHSVGYITAGENHSLVSNVTCHSLPLLLPLPTPGRPDAAIYGPTDFTYTLEIDVGRDIRKHLKFNMVKFFMSTPINNARTCLSVNTLGIPFATIFLFLMTMLSYWKTVRIFAVTVMHPTSTEAIYVHLPHALFWMVYGAYVPLILVIFGIYIQYSKQSPTLRLVFVLFNTLSWIVLCVLFIFPISANPMFLFFLNHRPHARSGDGGVLQYAVSSLAALNAISIPLLLLPKHERL
jgi:hypothetical protein